MVYQIPIHLRISKYVLNLHLDMKKFHNHDVFRLTNLLRRPTYFLLSEILYLK